MVKAGQKGTYLTDFTRAMAEFFGLPGGVRFDSWRDTFGSWWGADPDRRSTTDIDVVAADTQNKELLVGECKYRETFHETEAMRELERRAALVRGYDPRHFYLFSKHALSSGTIKKVEGMPEWHLVTVRDLYL